jgi:hypothetical protein
MAWSVRHDPPTGMIEVVYTAVVSATDLMEAASRRIALQHETGSPSVLVDVTGITELTARSADVLQLPASLFAAQVASRQTQLALVLPRSHAQKDMATFWETACVNRGWIARTFEDRQEAIDWLLATDPAGGGR